MSVVLMTEVVAVHPLTPNVLTVTLDGPQIGRLAHVGADQRVKLLFPRAGQSSPTLPADGDWYGSWRALPDDDRPVMRTYTLRSRDPRTGRVDVEFVLHGDGGPASAWACSARPGDRLGIIGSTAADGLEARPYAPGNADWQLLAGDATALPAIASIVADLPAGACARVFVQVPEHADARHLDTVCEDVQVTWLTGAGTGPVEALRAATWPAGVPYAWVAGEAAMVRAVRRHLVAERGLDAREHYFGGYWRAGVAEDAA